MIIDLGTGDGQAVLARAATEPTALVIGVDAVAPAMAQTSGRADRGRLENVIFLANGVKSLVGSALEGAADLVTVTFPWGSLLRGVVGLDALALAGIASVVAPAGRIEVMLSVVPADRVDGLPVLDESCVSSIRSAWACAGLELLAMRPATLSEIRATRSSWGRRLGSGRDVSTARPVWRLEGRRLDAAH